jgi:mRNA capping enzyme, beta chain
MESGVAEEYYDEDENSLPEVSDEEDYETQASGAEQSAGQSGEGQSDEERGEDEEEEQAEESVAEQSDSQELDEALAEESAEDANEWPVAEEPPTEEQLAFAQTVFEVLADGPSKAEEPVEKPSAEEEEFATAIVDALIIDGCIIPEQVPETRKRGASSTCSEPTVKRRKYDVPPPWAEKSQWGQIRDMDPWVPNRRRQSDDFQPDEILRYKVPQLERRAPPPNDARHRAAPSTRPNGIHPVPIRPGERPWEATRPKGMEWSLDNAVPYSDITREVANFLFGNVVEAPPLNIGKLEVEARLGVLMDTDSNQRLFLPISSEAIINSTVPLTTRFESLMSRVSLPLDW